MDSGSAVTRKGDESDVEANDTSSSLNAACGQEQEGIIDETIKIEETNHPGLDSDGEVNATTRWMVQVRRQIVFAQEFLFHLNTVHRTERVRLHKCRIQERCPLRKQLGVSQGVAGSMYYKGSFDCSGIETTNYQRY